MLTEFLIFFLLKFFFKKLLCPRNFSLHTRIDLYDGTASLDLAYEVAEEFGLDPGKARKIAREVAVAVKDWDKEAIRFGAGKDEVECMRSAFDLHQALKGEGKGGYGKRIHPFGRMIPSFFIRVRSVLEWRPSLSAAFAFPLIFHPHSSMTFRMCVRSISSRFCELGCSGWTG